MSSASVKKAGWVVFAVALTAFFTSYAWINTSHYTLSREVTRLADLSKTTEDIHNKWDNGYALDRRIAVVEGQMDVAVALGERINKIDEKVDGVQQEISMLGNDVSWIRKYMEKDK